MSRPLTRTQSSPQNRKGPLLKTFWWRFCKEPVMESWDMVSRVYESRSRSWRFQVWSRSRRLQVSRLWILQRDGLVKLL